MYGSYLLFFKTCELHYDFCISRNQFINWNVSFILKFNSIHSCVNMQYTVNEECADGIWREKFSAQACVIKHVAWGIYLSNGLTLRFFSRKLVFISDSISKQLKTNVTFARKLKFNLEEKQGSQITAIVIKRNKFLALWLMLNENPTIQICKSSCKYDFAGDISYHIVYDQSQITGTDHHST